MFNAFSSIRGRHGLSRNRSLTKPLCKNAQLSCRRLEDRLAPATLFGVTTANALVSFDSATPGTVSSPIAITGLQSGENILDFDVRPLNNQLIALGSSNRLYSINTTTGAATAIGSAGAFTLTGTNFGIDFNPVADRLRVVSDSDINLRLNPIDGTLTSTDVTLNFATGDTNFGANPDVVSVAYTNSVAGASTTTLYGIDTNLDILITQDPPNNGTLNTVGKLNVDATAVSGFDIASGSTTGLAVLTVAGTSGLYSINLTTGAATLVGSVGPTGTVLRGLALAPTNGGGGTGGIKATLSGTTATITGTDKADTIVIDASGGLLRHNLFTSGNAGFVSDFDFDSTVAGEQTLSVGSKSTVIVNAGDGNDTVTIGSKDSAAATVTASFEINGQGSTHDEDDDDNGQGQNGDDDDDDDDQGQNDDDQGDDDEHEGGGDVVNIQDSADTTGRTINISDTEVAIGTSPTIKYATIESLNVFAGSGVDTVTIESTASGVNTTVDLSAGGEDVVHVGTSFSGGTNSLNDIEGRLRLIGNSDSNQVFVDDSDNTTNTVFMIRGNEARRIHGPRIALSDFELIDVTGGTGRDRFHAKPDVDAEIAIHGGLPSPPTNPGDRLFVNRGGTTGAKLTANPTPDGFEGEWTFTNRQTITFDGIEKVVPASAVVVGADKGGGPHFRVFDSTTGKEKFGKFAFDKNFHGGIRVAAGDVNGDGTADVIIAAGSGGGPHVKIFDGDDGTLIREFFAFDASFHGGLFVASGDVNGDGFDDVIVGAGDSGGPHVRVFSGADGTLLREFFAFDAGFRGGVHVASGDVNADGFDDIIVAAGAGGGPHVKVISGKDGSLLTQFFAFDAKFRGGVFVSSLDADDDGDDDIVTSAGEGGGPHVIIRNGRSLAVMKSFFAFDADFHGGVRVAAADVNNDGVNDLLVSAGQGKNSPRFRAVDVEHDSELEDKDAFDHSFKGGVFVGGM